MHVKKWTTEERRPLKKPRHTLEDNTTWDLKYDRGVNQHSI